MSFHNRETSLRDALDRIAARARIRLSYSAEALPLDRRVCVALDSVALGDALTIVLGGAAIRLETIGSDHVVLAPVPAESGGGGEPVLVELERIVVTGTVAGAAQRGLPVALDILDGRELERRAANTGSAALNAAVPGVWVWEQSPAGLLAQYASIRGASSFGTTYPKVYLDGIQLANPLLLTRFQPGLVERIEVIRGPQGAALYGADAISGVANIVSRHDAGAESPRARLGAGFGLASSLYAPDPALEQSYAAGFRVGSSTRSAALDVDAGGIGEYSPSLHSRRLMATAVGRRVGEKTILTGTIRFFGMRAGTGESPILIRLLKSFRDSASGPLAIPKSGTATLTQYTLGTTVRFFPGDRWQHTFVAGVDGYALDGVPDQHSPIPFGSVSTLDDARGAAARGTLRASSVLKLDSGERNGADLTFSVEQSALRERAVVDQTTPSGDGSGTETEVVRWRGNTGLTAQANARLGGQVFLTGGVRVERDEGSAGTGRWATLPMAGAAWTRELGALSFKLRGAYGKGIRWPEIPARETLWEGLRPHSSAATLLPEEQSGFEVGMDLYLAGQVSLQVTRFDQVASGLIQRVAFARDTGLAVVTAAQRIGYRLQNVGEVTNRGWEVQGSLREGAFSLTGAFSRVDSRVRKLAHGYTGDLRPGDRMLEVPARTASLTTLWSGSRWQASLTAYRAFDWIGYDRVALAREFATTSRPTREFVGDRLRQFWIKYPGVTHLRATVGATLAGRFGVTLSGDNLLDRQTGEPDNITVLPGRTISFGVRTEF
ncbi:MAG TPA: TonB-dependent receptor [Gemmatimonadales bacterium]|nr:TonB-dependent receptor [Gemmatimonadales bacterium]